MDHVGCVDVFNEVHSFGTIFTGCFYVVLAAIFKAQSSRTEAALLTSARKAGALLVRGAATAVVAPRFFQSVGRAMVLADDEINRGANQDIIRTAFGRHNIMLGADAMLGATAVLAGRRTARGRGTLAVDQKRSGKLPKGATHELTTDSDGEVTVVRKRFSAI